MSVWAKAAPVKLSLPGSEGALVSVSILIAPRRLESLLEALARIDFPINPRIDHEAGEGTLVEFPAYENRLDEVRRAVQAADLDEGCLRVTSMMEAIHQNP